MVVKAGLRGRCTGWDLLGPGGRFRFRPGAARPAVVGEMVSSARARPPEESVRVLRCPGCRASALALTR